MIQYTLIDRSLSLFGTHIESNEQAYCVIIKSAEPVYTPRSILHAKSNIVSNVEDLQVIDYRLEDEMRTKNDYDNVRYLRRNGRISTCSGAIAF